MGVILMIAIVVVLSGVVGVMVVGFAGSPEPAPTARFDSEYVPDGEGNSNDRPYLVLTHTGGESVDGSEFFVVDDGGHRIAWEDVWTAGSEVNAGEYVHLDGYGSDSVLGPACQGTTYRIVWQPGPERTLVVLEHEITAPPRGAARSHC